MTLPGGMLSVPPDREGIQHVGILVDLHRADYVTTADNNHDGVAEAIEKFILN